MASGETAHRRGRPAQISRDGIVQAAIAIGNLDALTMRALAAELGVSHGALYRWVRDRDELFDLISEVLVDRVFVASGPRSRGWRSWLERVAWAMHDEYLAVPGFATRLSRPHRHSDRAYARVRSEIVDAFTAAGTSAELAEQSWFIFVTSVVSWLAAEESATGLSNGVQRFELLVDCLLRGLPAREPVGAHRSR